jgi:hypothetical protein
MPSKIWPRQGRILFVVAATFLAVLVAATVAGVMFVVFGQWL